jgi:hypothetical protein
MLGTAMFGALHWGWFCGAVHHFIVVAFQMVFTTASFLAFASLCMSF